MLSGGLGDLVERFKQSGHGQAADSWVRHRSQSTTRARINSSKRSAPMCWTRFRSKPDSRREELLSRLTRELPAAVDKFTPEGRLPTEEEAARFIHPG